MRELVPAFTPLRLLKYAPAPFSLDLDRAAARTGWGKPFGTWVSVGDAWKEWCEFESFGLGDLAVVHEMVLKPDHNVLTISSKEGLVRFAEVFARESDYGYWMVEWDRVRDLWDGIIISPYLWGAWYLDERLRFYYGWDCASGCVWDLRAVWSFEVVETSSE